MERRLARILQYQHWEVFLVICAPMLVFSTIPHYAWNAVYYVYSYSPSPELGDALQDIDAWNDWDWLAVQAYTLAISAWLYAVALLMTRRAPEGVKLPFGWFQAAFWYSLVHALAIGRVVWLAQEWTFESRETMLRDGQGMLRLQMAFMPFRWLATFCYFYTLWYCAKTLKSVELRRPASFGECVLNIVLLHFFYVGVWLLQPKAGRLLNYPTRE